MDFGLFWIYVKVRFRIFEDSFVGSSINEGLKEWLCFRDEKEYFFIYGEFFDLLLFKVDEDYILLKVLVYFFICLR